MRIYWLEQVREDLPAGYDWLSPAESARLEELRVPKRRADWLLGRWTVKRAVSQLLCLAELPLIEVRPAASGAPELFLEGRSSRLAISITHTGERAACCVGGAGAALGCDLETIEPRSDAFITDYFTPSEQAAIRNAPEGERPVLANLLWSAKESALKALGEGLRLDTRRASVTLHETALQFGAWQPLAVRVDGALLRGWWRSDPGMLRTAVAAPPAQPPVLL
jgi:4'-phosphopantetheinyl transferase